MAKVGKHWRSPKARHSASAPPSEAPPLPFSPLFQHGGGQRRADGGVAGVGSRVAEGDELIMTLISFLSTSRRYSAPVNLDQRSRWRLRCLWSGRSVLRLSPASGCVGDAAQLCDMRLLLG